MSNQQKIGVAVSPSVLDRAREAALKELPTEGNPILFDNYMVCLPVDAPNRMPIGVVEINGVRYEVCSQ